MFGADKAALLDNGSLNAALVKNVVRHGLGQMPPFRPGELSDSQLDQLANYLASGPHPNDGSPAWGYP
jgi:mono/diheme cytochrome c family protein